MDLYDGADGLPVIYHGGTLTGVVSVADILNDAVKPYAFKASPYPLYLSFENHLSAEQQIVLASQIRDSIGDHLCSIDVADMKQLPSPEHLRHKIIIKAKKYLHAGSNEKTERQPVDNHAESPKPDAADDNQANLVC